MKRRKYQKQEPKDEGPLIKPLWPGRNPVGEDGIKWRPLQKENRRILFNVFFKKKKIAYLGYLKKTVPIFLNLHPSFWENQHFLRWQLIRLNTEYQTSVEKIWYDRWTRAGITEQQQIEKYFFDFRASMKTLDNPFVFS